MLNLPFMWVQIDTLLESFCEDNDLTINDVLSGIKKMSDMPDIRQVFQVSNMPHVQQVFQGSDISIVQQVFRWLHVYKRLKNDFFYEHFQLRFKTISNWP